MAQNVSQNMNQKTDWFTWLLILLAISSFGAAAWFVYQDYKQKNMPALLPEGTVSDNKASAASATNEPKGIVEKVKDAVKTVIETVTPNSDGPFPLQKGSRGEEVKNLQHYINLKSIANLVEDGVFGTKTETVLKNLWKTTSVSKAEYIKMMKEIYPGYTYGALPQSNYGGKQDQNIA